MEEGKGKQLATLTRTTIVIKWHVSTFVKPNRLQQRHEFTSSKYVDSTYSGIQVIFQSLQYRFHLTTCITTRTVGMKFHQITLVVGSN